MGKPIYRLGIVCLALIAGFVQAATVPSQEEINSRFAELQKDYFLRLDLRAPQKFLQSTPQFAARLHQLADEQRARLKAQPSLSSAEKENAGLIFIYDAMLTSDVNLGIEKGIFSLTDFSKEKKFSNTNDQNTELKARAEYALTELQEAAKLRPNDRRLDGWIVGAKTNIEILQTNAISKKTQAEILKMIPARPSFNLWTAILLLHTQDASQLEGLQKAAQNFVDNTTKGNDPCVNRPEDCLNGPKAPYNLQAAIVELGDVFLRRAEYYLIEDDIKNSMEMVGYADGTYSQLNKPKFAATTRRWPDYDAIQLRADYMHQLKNKQLPSEPLAKQDLYQRVYECGSCHGRVGNPAEKKGFFNGLFKSKQGVMH